MAGLLLDTHTLIWFALGDATQMPQATAELIQDPQNNVFVSAASVWEIATKSRLGKLAGVEDIAARPSYYVSELAMAGLPITLAHASRAGLFAAELRDPFDRILAAQSQLEDLALVSVDDALDTFGVQRLWPE